MEQFKGFGLLCGQSDPELRFLNRLFSVMATNLEIALSTKWRRLLSLKLCSLEVVLVQIYRETASNVPNCSVDCEQ